MDWQCTDAQSRHSDWNTEERQLSHRGSSRARTSGSPDPGTAVRGSILNPAIDWVALARRMGVPAVRCDTAEAFERAFAGAMATRGLLLIEARIQAGDPGNPLPPRGVKRPRCP
ncbi:MAG TPA: thiamine pyrophosphate-dependent enzyme [Sphingopyxis sp.]|uniref:thiamine pyrophosphate-dependent enzyme n=1 Tax=Sphingopyxis sp. TaxID=1908224 RepID=UPI002BB9E0ED|nr:thiamine pyrophosphate-dependent enzyme [Sphingopyxis sp.]HWW59358.1 thiamine pyrophosphate-dependent enzyme [Sphingopyxis sp.]